MRRSLVLLDLLLLSAGLFLGCSRTQLRWQPEDRSSAGSAGGTGGSGAGGESPGGGGTGGTGGGELDAGPDVVLEDAGFPPIVEEIFVNSGSTLFRFDINTFTLTPVGPFLGCGASVIDLALDSQGRMFGSTLAGLFDIDPVTAVCTMIAPGPFPNSLCIVPQGTVDPDDEALVGYLDAQYVRIDKVTGAFTVLGKLGTNGYKSSGDMVVLPNGRAFLTIKGKECSDCLVEIDPKKGTLLDKVGKLPFSQVFGLSSSLGKGFGFTAGGEAFQIDLVTASTMQIMIPNGPANVGFFGAASRPTP